ncbi:MAG: hypothetical protein LUQ39_02185 [Methanomassiliicoccales archaeon]|nr:hypothetical protein [Methanomassiliicoccales archaeon]
MEGKIMGLDEVPFLPMNGRELLDSYKITDPNQLLGVNPINKLVELAILPKLDRIQDLIDRVGAERQSSASLFDESQIDNCEDLDKLKAQMKEAIKVHTSVLQCVGAMEETVKELRIERYKDQLLLNSLRLVGKWVLDKNPLQTDWSGFKTLNDEVIKKFVVANAFRASSFTRPRNLEELYLNTWDKYTRLFIRVDIDPSEARMVWDSIVAALSTALEAGGPSSGGGGLYPGTGTVNQGGGGLYPGGGGLYPGGGGLYPGGGGLYPGGGGLYPGGGMLLP